MNREQMIEELKKGKQPIDVSIQKWVDILNTHSVNRLRARHQFDEGKSNCALCYVFEDCKLCPIFLKYKVKCDGSKSRNNRKYKKDFYSQYRDTGNAQIMVDMLNSIKHGEIKHAVSKRKKHGYWYFKGLTKLVPKSQAKKSAKIYWSDGMYAYIEKQNKGYMVWIRNKEIEVREVREVKSNV